MYPANGMSCFKACRHVGTASRQATSSLAPIKASIMSMSVHVGLLSGHSCVVDTNAAQSVGELRRKVQQKLRIGVSAFVDDSGEMLPEHQSLSDSDRSPNT